MDCFHEAIWNGLNKNDSLPHVSPRLGISLLSGMASPYTFLRTVFRYAQILLISSSSSALGGTLATCSNPQISCQNTTAVADTCCFNAPGGLFPLTQFWDYSPAVGPSDSWTIHGLWPDNCDGTYDAYCDPARTYTNLSSIVSAAGSTDLLNYMSIYWKDYRGDDETLWEHEWDKHGTCISTLEPGCYSNYKSQEEVVAYFQKTVDLFKTLPSYTWLSNAGIKPSTTATYTSAEIITALNSPRGVDVTIQCANSNELDEIWYYYVMQGSVPTGTFIPANPGTVLYYRPIHIRAILTTFPSNRWSQIPLPSYRHKISSQDVWRSKFTLILLEHNHLNRGQPHHSPRHPVFRQRNPPSHHRRQSNRLHYQRRDMVHHRHLRDLYRHCFRLGVHADE